MPGRWNGPPDTGCASSTSISPGPISAGPSWPVPTSAAPGCPAPGCRAAISAGPTSEGRTSGGRAWRHAFLGGADLRQADLREADLSRADLRGAFLAGADLRGTILTGARLADALCDWRWSAVPAELLRQQHGASAECSRLVVDMAFHDDPGPWSWLKLLAGHGRRADRALAILAGSVREGDNAPDLLRCLAADATGGRDGTPKTRRSSPGQVADLAGQDRNSAAGFDSPLATPSDLHSAPRMMWTCRKAPRVEANRNAPAP